jgi:hypothetical protein
VVNLSPPASTARGGSAIVWYPLVLVAPTDNWLRYRIHGTRDADWNRLTRPGVDHLRLMNDDEFWLICQIKSTTEKSVSLRDTKQ